MWDPRAQLMVTPCTLCGSCNSLSKHGMHGRLGAIQQAVDAAIISYVAYKNGMPNVDVNMGASVGVFEVYTGSNNLFNSASSNIVAIAGPVMLVCGVTVTALMMLNLVTTEKYNKLLGALRSVGVSEGAHWLSWFSIFIVLSFVMAIVTASFGMLSHISLFSKCEWSVHFIAFFMFMCSMGAMSIWLGSFVARPVWVNVVSFMMFSFATVITFCLTTLISPDELYAPGVSPIVAFIVFLQPWMQYGMILHDILTFTAAKKVGNHQVSRSFGWSDLSHKMGPLPGEVNGVPVEWYAPSAAYNLGAMAALCAIYLLLAWYVPFVFVAVLFVSVSCCFLLIPVTPNLVIRYFGQVFAGDLGASQRFYFIFDPAYWGFKKPENILPGDTLAVEKEKSRADQSIRLHKLSKACVGASGVVGCCFRVLWCPVPCDADLRH